MAKSAQTRMDKFELAPLIPWAESVVKANGILARAIALENGLEAIETRKTQAQQELADVLAKTEAAKQTHAAVTAEATQAIDTLRAQRQGEQDGLREDRAARARAADDDARDYKKRNDALAASMREENDRLRAENKGLREQRVALQKDLDETLSRYTSARR